MICKIAEQLPPNDAACGFKLASQALAVSLRGLYRNYRLQHPTDPDLPCEPWPGHVFVSTCNQPDSWRALTLRQRRRLLGLAAASGDAASLDAALAHGGASASAKEALGPPAAAGCIPALERLLQLPGGTENVGVAACAAAGAGQLRVLQWLHQRPDYRGGLEEARLDVTAAAAHGRQGAVIEWLMQQPGLVTCEAPAAQDWAMMAGALGCEPVLARALAATPPEHRKLVLPQVVYGCSLPVLQQHFDALVGDAAEVVGRRPLQLNVSTAAASPTADWLQKVEYLEQRWAAAAAAAGQDAAAVRRRVRLHWAFVPLAIFNVDGGALAREAPPDYVQRLQALMARGYRLDCASLAEAPGPAGLRTLQWLLDEQAYQPAADARKLKELSENAPLATLQLLRARGVICDRQLLGVLWERRWERGLWLARDLEPEALAALVVGLEDPEPGAHWGLLFRTAAEQGAPLALLRALHERRGAAVHLHAMVRGGYSVEALEWARQALQELGAAAAAATAQVGGCSVSDVAVWAAACAGNFAAADWLCDRGLVSAPAQQQPAGEGAASLLDAEWVVAAVGAAKEWSPCKLKAALLGLAWWRRRPAQEELSPEQEERISRLTHQQRLCAWR